MDGSLVCSISSFSICMKIHIPLLPSTSLKESYIEGIDTSDIFFSRYLEDTGSVTSKNVSVNL
jgi:hypothetical protein